MKISTSPTLGSEASTKDIVEMKLNAYSHRDNEIIDVLLQL